MLTTDEFFHIVQTALAEKKPFAMTRFSDGELMLLNRHAYYAEYSKIVTKLWGYKPNESDLQRVSEYLKEAIIKSDIIGFPTPRHLARSDYFKDAISVYEEHIGSVSLKDKKKVSVDIAWGMLAGSAAANSNALMPDYFEELLRDRHSLYYVSCWDLDEAFKRRYGIRHVKGFQTPPEPKFTSGYVGERHYPYVFEDIRKQIKAMDCTGGLCLVGGGVFSKMYNIWFKEQGGVSLDVGSIMDAFYGRSTRGPQRGLDVEDLTYKL